tara:strand:+ start:370 stop:621 length:252 start_codon:yes stop_codon:yes gene_type:complete
MEISLLDFCLINILSYIAGLGTGLIVCCKNKDRFFIKSSSSSDDLSQIQTHEKKQYPTPPLLSSAPLAAAPLEYKHPVKITLE